MLTVTLPWPPSANNTKAIFRGRAITTKVAREYRKAAVAAIREQVGNQSIAGPVVVTIDLYGPMHTRNGRRRAFRSYDIANMEKTVIDAIVAAVIIEDDRLIDKLYMRRCEQVESGKAVVMIDQISERCDNDKD